MVDRVPSWLSEGLGLRPTSVQAVHRRQNKVAQKTPRKTLAQNGENILFAPSRVWSAFPVRAMEFIFGPCNYVQRYLILDYKKNHLEMFFYKESPFLIIQKCTEAVRHEREISNAGR
jgi:hypothetical protein